MHSPVMLRLRSPIVLLLLLLLALAGATSCASTQTTEVRIDSPSGGTGIWAGYLGATATTDGISLSNQTERPLYVFAIERETATRTDWRPCMGGPGCEPLVQGGRRTLPWSSIIGYSAEKKEYLVYSWRVEPDAAGVPRQTGLTNAVVTR